MIEKALAIDEVMADRAKLIRSPLSGGYHAPRPRL